MGRLVEEWLKNYPRTEGTYRQGIRAFEVFFGKDADLLIEERHRTWSDRPRLKANDNYIARFYYWLQERGLASGTARLRYAAVRSFCSYHGVDLGRAPRGMKAVVEYEEGKYPRQEELARMVDAARSWRDKAFIILVAQSGARRSMACALKVRNIEGYKSGWVLSKITWDPEQRKRYGFKGANILVFGPETAEYLGLMLQERREKGETVTPESWVFTTSTGRPLSPGHTNERIVKRAAAAAGLLTQRGKRCEIHCHSLRKFFNNQLIAAGTPELYRELWMNHVIDPTKRAYFNPRRQEILNAYKQAYTKLSVKGVTPQLDKMEEQMRQQDIQIIELRLSLSRMQETVKTLKENPTLLPQQQPLAPDASAQRRQE